MHDVLPFGISQRSGIRARRRTSHGLYSRVAGDLTAGCVIGAVVRSAALVSVLPGRQERRFVVTTVSG
jgi:hypothetical protein